MHLHYLFICLIILACSEQPDPLQMIELESGCDGQTYPDPSKSAYVLPFAVGKTYKTGLTNCSSSYHAAGYADQYAFDFDMPLNTPFLAARSGKVYEIREKASDPSPAGITGNYIIIKHDDASYGIYLHSPENGISVNVGDEVHQGQVLGVTGMSGLAGYPHLHLIVVTGQPKWPYSGLAISFKNASPNNTVLQSYTNYTATKY